LAVLYTNAQRIIKAALSTIDDVPIAFVTIAMAKDIVNAAAIISTVVKKEIIKCLI